MLKRKEKNKLDKVGKSQLIVGSLLVLIGITIISCRVYLSLSVNKEEHKALDNFYIVQEELKNEEDNEELLPEKQTEVKEVKQTSINYIATIEIPKINLKRGLVDKNSSANNVKRNIQILKESDMPDVENGNFILASHSGNSNISFFKNLYKLQNDDVVNIEYGGKQYQYKMVNSYEIEKTGEAHIIRNGSKTTLTLITCIHNTNKQLVVICELIKE